MNARISQEANPLSLAHRVLRKIAMVVIAFSLVCCVPANAFAEEPAGLLPEFESSSEPIDECAVLVSL